MKAFSYIDFCGLKESEMLETIKAVIPIENTLFRKCNKDWDDLFLKICYEDNCESYFYDIYRDHVKQPFTPELITKYFKGWREFETISNIGRRLSGYETDISKIRIDNFHEMEYEATKGEPSCSWFKIPRTLDDFINDTQRAGIELEWKDA
jgi:hypothetical protein